MNTSHGKTETRAGPDPASELLDIVGTLFAELHRHTGQGRPITLDNSLDRDLGFDSLARVELILRIQRAFGVDLPEDTLVRAETPRDLLDALHRGTRGSARRASRQSVPTLESAQGEAVDAHHLARSDRLACAPTARPHPGHPSQRKWRTAHHLSRAGGGI